MLLPDTLGMCVHMIRNVNVVELLSVGSTNVEYTGLYVEIKGFCLVAGVYFRGSEKPCAMQNV